MVSSEERITRRLSGLPSRERYVARGAPTSMPMTSRNSTRRISGAGTAATV
jgi:hypothetical protein